MAVETALFVVRFLRNRIRVEEATLYGDPVTACPDYLCLP